MTPEQEQHLAAIQAAFKEQCEAKYRKGQQEHGGNLWERRTVNDLEPEIVDAWTYMQCIKADFRRINQFAVLAQMAIDSGDLASAKKNLGDIYALTKLDPH